MGIDALPSERCMICLVQYIFHQVAEFIKDGRYRSVLGNLRLVEGCDLFFRVSAVPTVGVASTAAAASLESNRP